MAEQSSSKGLVRRTVRLDDDLILISLHGHLRMAEADLFDELIEEVDAHPQRGVAIDLTGLHYMDSTGLSGLTRLHWHLARRGLDLTLLDPPEPILAVLHMARLDQLFRILQGPQADAVRIPS